MNLTLECKLSLFVGLSSSPGLLLWLCEGQWVGLCLSCSHCWFMILEYFSKFRIIFLHKKVFLMNITKHQINLLRSCFFVWLNASRKVLEITSCILTFQCCRAL
ncbi:unnamed protein product [Moneuplotes crassus]|uniref:Uncharacterized protein n=1 Tax=Euplotes crassus TaxID=5936 RepID=A0AAD1XZE5_EUPCR|nr:unnamed protein product [Moneuplotes crassus]